MTRFVIEKVRDGDQVPPDVDGLRCTVTIPDGPPEIETWRDVLRWFYVDVEVPRMFHMAVMALYQTFHSSKNPR